MAVGMGLPGPLRRETREVGDLAILPGWIGMQPEQLMHAQLGLPVLVDNDGGWRSRAFATSSLPRSSSLAASSPRPVTCC
jgi:hypothetical protein